MTWKWTLGSLSVRGNLPQIPQSPNPPLQKRDPEAGRFSPLNMIGSQVAPKKRARAAGALKTQENKKRNRTQLGRNWREPAWKARLVNH
jgi:hypothetical protein